MQNSGIILQFTTIMICFLSEIIMKIFPDGYVLELTNTEVDSLRSKFSTLVPIDVGTCLWHVG